MTTKYFSCKSMFANVKQQWEAQHHKACSCLPFIATSIAIAGQQLPGNNNKRRCRNDDGVATGSTVNQLLPTTIKTQMDLALSIEKC